MNVIEKKTTTNKKCRSCISGRPSLNVSIFHNEHLKKCCSSSFSPSRNFCHDNWITCDRYNQENYNWPGVCWLLYKWSLSEFSKMTIMAGVTIISSRLKKKNFQIYSRKTKSTMNGKRRRWMLQLPKKSLNQLATLKVLLKTPKSIFQYGLVWFMWSVPQEGGIGAY